jgi:hypothetical protein
MTPDNELKRSVMLGAEDMKEYVKAFSRSGFRGGLNFYRNIEENWIFSKKAIMMMMQHELIEGVGSWKEDNATCFDGYSWKRSSGTSNLS